MYRWVLPRRGSRRGYLVRAKRRTDIIWAMSMVSRDCTPKIWNHNIVIHTTKLETPYYLGVDVIQYMTIISIQLTAPHRSILDTSSKEAPLILTSFIPKWYSPPAVSHPHIHTHKHIRLLDPPNREHINHSDSSRNSGGSRTSRKSKL